MDHVRRVGERHDTSLSLTPSADDILEVSPVNSVDEDVPGNPARPASRLARGLPPMSPTPAVDDVDALTLRGPIAATEHPSPGSRRILAEEAFSSSSDDDHDDDGQNELKDKDQRVAISMSRSASRSTQRVGFSQSEFDKALITGDGVPNRGSASFDVPRDTTDFFTHADHSVVHEAMSTEESVDSPERSAPRFSRHRSSRRTQSNTSATAPSKGGGAPPPPPPPPPPPLRQTLSITSRASEGTTSTTAHRSTTSTTVPTSTSAAARRHNKSEDVSAGVLPDVLMTMRQKIESLTLFDSDMMRLAQGDFPEDDRILQETRETLKRSSQQSISAAVLVSLAHKRYERRRLAAMEIEKVVRSLVQQGELERVRAILLLLSDDYVRSTSEDARKGGVVALAACAIGLKKASDEDTDALECRDLILASVVHACQDHSQRVRYYATESLFNVVKVIPALAVQHFFILFEILRSLYADVDVDVQSGAELLNKKLKEVIVGAINSGSFSADACVPIFARFVYIRNKATKRLTLTWLQELNEKLIGAPILEFLHLFLSGIFAMVADPNVSIRQSALAFLQSVLPKLLADNAAFDDEGASMKVDFDKILQSLVTTMEHPDPFVRKVAMYWMSRIVKAHIGVIADKHQATVADSNDDKPSIPRLSAASMSVRNSLPHVLPGILLSIGDTFHNRSSTKDSFLPDQTTRSLAEQTNACLQNAVSRDGSAYVSHLDGFIVALREELDSPGGLNARNPPAVERNPYRMDVTPDGTGIESPGWFRSSKDDKNNESMTMSRLCALHWVVVLYESVVPDMLKAQYAREFITPIIHQLVDDPPAQIISKSLEVLAKITVPVEGETPTSIETSSTPTPEQHKEPTASKYAQSSIYPMTDTNVQFALDVMDSLRRQSKSRDRKVFSVLIQLHAHNHQLLSNLARVIQIMCTLQAPEFVFVSFAVELDRFVRKQSKYHEDKTSVAPTKDKGHHQGSSSDLSTDLEFVSSFVQQMNHVLLNTDEASELRTHLRDCIGSEMGSDRRRVRLFHILLHSFSHNLASSISLCLWGGAFRTSLLFLTRINPLDINLIFLVELDKLVEMLERPLFRHLHVHMLECDNDPWTESSSSMLCRTLKTVLMLIPQSTCYKVLRDRLVTVSRFRLSTLAPRSWQEPRINEETESFVSRVLEVRNRHCVARWHRIRADSLETAGNDRNEVVDEEASRRQWLGYDSKEAEATAKVQYQEQKRRIASGFSIEEVKDGYHDLDSLPRTSVINFLPNDDDPYPVPKDAHPSEQRYGTTDTPESDNNDGNEWKTFWAKPDAEN